MYTDKFLRGERGNACLDEWEVRLLARVHAPSSSPGFISRGCVCIGLPSLQDYRECMVQSLKAKNLGHLLDPKR